MTPPGTALAKALGARLPVSIGLGEADPTAPAEGLWPGEDLPGAVETRLREFAAGRRAARHAMAAIDLPPASIPMGPDRAPQWPGDMLGSISHGGGLCLALAAREDSGVAMLGLDIEPATALEPDLWEAVLTGPERAALPDGPAAGHQAKWIFSAKEAAYKAQYRLSAQILEFHDMEVRLTGTGFSARLTRAAGPLGPGTVLNGICVTADGLLATAICAEADGISRSAPGSPASAVQRS